MDPELILKAGQSIAALASLLHGNNLGKIKDAAQKLAAVVVADLPDGAMITEEALVEHAHQIIEDAETRRQRINVD